MEENKPVTVYDAVTNIKIKDYESVQRAVVRLQLKSPTTIHRIVDKTCLDGRPKTAFSKMLQKRIYLKKI